MNLCSSGHQVICTHYNDFENVNKLLEMSQNMAGSITFFNHDATKSEGIDKIIEYILDSYGKIDALINNAGYKLDKAFLLTSEHEWHEQMNIVPTIFQKKF